MSSCWLGDTVAVTGAGGFVGRHVVAELAPQFASVRALLGPMDSAPVWPANVQSRRVEVTSAAAMQHALDGVDAVVHLAGPPGVSASFGRAQHYSDVHVGGTANVVHALPPTARLIYLSSAEVYGQPASEFVNEQAVLAPLSPYGAAKCGAEQMIGSFVRSRNVSAVILRPFSIFGPGQSAYSLLASVLDQLRNAGSRAEVCVHDVAPIRDYVSIADVVRGVERAFLLPPGQGSEVVAFNLCSGRGLSVAELICRVGTAVGKQVRVRQRDTSDRPAAAVVQRLVGDPGRARDTLGWCSSPDLGEDLRLVYQS